MIAVDGASARTACTFTIRTCGTHAHAHREQSMRTIAALISAVLIPLAGCELYVDDERDVDASAVDAAPALDATMNDACVCEPHWPGCPSGCEAPAS